MGIPLASTIRQLEERIQAGAYQSEAEISRGVVQRILSELGWPTSDTEVVVPEFKISDGARKKVDYALCHPPGKPAILIEVKALGKANGQAEKQLFEYAFHQGVPIVVLTDGRIWNFFYPPGQGNYEDRRFAQIDLLNHDPDDVANKLTRYMNMEDVKSPLTRKNAEKDYEEVRLQKQAISSFESVWRKLLLLSEPKESLLLELFLDEVKKETGGVRPNVEQAIAFIRNKAGDEAMRTTSHAHSSAAVRKQQTGQPLPTHSQNSRSPSAMTHSPNQPSNSGSREAFYCVDGKIWQRCNDATFLMIDIVKWCAQQHVNGEDDYYEKLSCSYWSGKPILSKERATEDEKTLYSKKEIDGWYVFNCLPNQSKKRLIDKMLSVCIRSSGTRPVLDHDLQVRI